MNEVEETTIWTLSNLRDIVLTLVAVCSLFVAIQGLKTWRRELQGRFDFDLARRLLVATYRVRERLREVRSPFMSSGEMATAISELGLEAKHEEERERDPLSSRVGAGAAYDLRLRRLGDALTELSAVSLEVEAAWGHGKDEMLGDLHRLVSELRGKLAMYFHYLNQDPRSPRDIKRAEAIDAVIYDVSAPDAPDPFAKRVNEAVAALENLARPHLGRGA